ncbi:HAD family hydrolase [Leptothoe sp. PORK10 BA2]|nr:HAD family hydrolase [Leptothoe sp. PORK10 BA2]
MVTVFCNGQLFTDIHAVFLDKDGTLANVAAYLSQLGHTQAELMERQLPGSQDWVLRALGFCHGGLSPSGLLAVGSRQETIVGIAAAAAMVGCPWVEAMDLARTTLGAADQQHSPKAAYTPLLSGALEFLGRLRQAGLKIVMVSADGQENLEKFVQHYGLATYFDHLQGVSCQHPAKTSRNFLPAACQAIDCEPHQGLVIGDAASDWQMAQSTRGFIGYLGGWQSPLSKTDILGPAGAAQAGSQGDLSLARSFATDFSQIRLG